MIEPDILDRFATASGLTREQEIAILTRQIEEKMLDRQSPIHACPADGEGMTPCCGRNPFELPRTDRISLDANLVTCGR